MSAALILGAVPLALGQSAADAAQAMASALDGASAGISTADQLVALEAAAAAGDPVALWQLGVMYESGEGVPQDRAKAFGYFAEIADQHAEVSPTGLEAEIVARSFVKVSDYYGEGLPEAGVTQDKGVSMRLLLNAATYFGDAEAQYKVGLAYQDPTELGVNPLQSGRWLQKAALKGHISAQASLGNLLFNGGDGVDANPVEGLMWLTVASRRAGDTIDAGWINDLLNAAMSVATPEQREDAVVLADSLDDHFSESGF